MCPWALQSTGLFANHAIGDNYDVEESDELDSDDNIEGSYERELGDMSAEGIVEFF